MQKATPSESTNMINITISRFGHEPVILAVPTGSTVDQALNLVSLELSGREDMFVEGQQAEGGDVLENGDILSIVTPKQAG